MRKIILGFISGVIFVLAIIGNMTMDDIEKMTSSYNKKKFIDKIEYLLLGYNTIKTSPYMPRYTGKSYKSYRGSHTTSFADYYPNNDFEEDEEKEKEADFHCGVEESGGHAYNCNDCPNKCEEYYQWDKEMKNGKRKTEA